MSDDYNENIHDDPGVFKLNKEEDDRAAAELLAQPGWYVTDPSTTSLIRTTAKDGVRPIWVVVGLGTHVDDPAAEPTKVRLRGRMSPVKADGDVADFTYRQWNHPSTGLRAIYKRMIGQAPESDKDVEEFVTQYPIKMRLRRTGLDEGGNPLPDKEPGELVVAFGSTSRA
jgi:hypothetical protein